MSSFLQKNQLSESDILEKEKGEKLLPCPECGEIAMRHIRSDCTLKDGTFVPNLTFYYCSSCQSKFYDDAAMERIEIIRKK